MLIVAPAAGYESLVTLETADAYMLKMGSPWEWTDRQKETHLRRATQYLLSAYAIRPEYLDPVAANVQAACCEAALRASTGNLFEDVAAQYVQSVSVGPVSKTMSAPANRGQARFAVIDALLRGLTDGMSGTVKLVRA